LLNRTSILALFLCLITFQAQAVNLNIGGLGDGTTNETSTVQTALSDCSANTKTCVVESGKNYRVTGPLYMYGGASLTCADSTSKITFDVGTTKYPVQIGLSASLTAAAAWTGTISNCTFVMSGGTVTGRLLWLARSSGATITGNSFFPGNLTYSFTGSGVDGTYLVGAGNYIRSNLTITNNIIAAGANNVGSEGIGLEGFSTATISGNTISGVGDDPIGIHLSSDSITITNNNLSSVDGRVFISNSTNISITNNTISRMSSRLDGTFYAASNLLAVEHETQATNSNPAPESILIKGNTFIVPDGALDSVAAMYIRGARKIAIQQNLYYNYSKLATSRLLYIVPFTFTGTWTDPSGLDSTTTARPYAHWVDGNKSMGPIYGTMIMTGNCSDYVGPLDVHLNQASSYQYYCLGSVTQSWGNKTISNTPVTRTTATTRSTRN